MRFPKSVALFSALVVACVAVVMPGRDLQAAPYAAIVMDMRDGRVIYARSADNRQHPASLTKMMTLYIVFEEIRAGRLKLDQKVRVSSRAASQPPSKLHLKAGQRVSIRHLVRAAALKSANDAAVVLAEAVAGTEARFAKLMTRKARELGMTNTTFRNASGLTRSGHLSTARDMGILARHLYFNFPEYWNLFGRVSAHAAGRTVWNTNRLLRSYSGADGIKTGYTRAAGYNLATTAQRGSKRVVVVVMGMGSPSGRNKEAARLLDLGFKRAKSRVAVVRPSFHRSGSKRPRVEVVQAPLPPRPPFEKRRKGGSLIAEALAPSAIASDGPGTPEIIGSEFAPYQLAKMPLPRPVEGSEDVVEVVTATPTTAPTAAPVNAAPVNAATDTAVPVTAAAIAAAPAPVEVRIASAGSAVPLPPRRPGAAAGPSAAAGRWMVQIGAFTNHELAVARLAEAQLGDLRSLSGASPAIDEQIASSGRKLYMVRFKGMTEARAVSACQEIRKLGGDCLTIAPRG